MPCNHREPPGKCSGESIAASASLAADVGYGRYAATLLGGWAVRLRSVESSKPLHKAERPRPCAVSSAADRIILTQRRYIL